MAIGVERQSLSNRVARAVNHSGTVNVIMCSPVVVRVLYEVLSQRVFFTLGVEHLGGVSGVVGIDVVSIEWQTGRNRLLVSIQIQYKIQLVSGLSRNIGGL